MEKIDESKSKTYQPVVLWADDLEALMLELTSIGATARLVSDGIKYDSLKEFIDHRKGAIPKRLELQGDGCPFYVSVQFDRRRCWLYVSSSKTDAIGLFYILDQTIAAAERRPRILYSWKILLVLNAIMAFGLFLEFFVTIPKSWALWLAISVPTVVAAVTQLYVSNVKAWRFSVIHPVFRHAPSNFLRENKNAILLSALSAFCGAVFTALVTVAVRKFFP